MSSQPNQPSVADRFALVIDGLCRAAAMRMAAERAVMPLLMLVWSRLRRMATRLAALAAKAQAGTLPAPRPQTLRAASPAAPRPAPPLRVPNRIGLLIRLVPDTRQFAGQVQALLADPEMAALLAAAPQAGRILRPLCRMLAIRPGQPLAPPSPAKPPRPVAAPRRPKPPDGLRLPPPRTALRRLRALAGIPPPSSRWKPA